MQSAESMIRRGSFSLAHDHFR